MNNAIERVTNYKLNNSIFRISYGDITKFKVDAIVSSDDNYLSLGGGGGVSAAILEDGGPDISKDAIKRVLLRVGEVAVTTTGNLPVKYIFYANTIDYTNMIFMTEGTLNMATLK
jgi:O-acetyl-ADP-ribose deacetylase (regulator of RNase III)